MCLNLDYTEDKGQEYSDMAQPQIVQPDANREVSFDSRGVSSRSTSYSLGKSKVCPKSLEVIQCSVYNHIVETKVIGGFSGIVLKSCNVVTQR